MNETLRLCRAVKRSGESHKQVTKEIQERKVTSDVEIRMMSFQLDLMYCAEIPN